MRPSKTDWLASHPLIVLALLALSLMPTRLSAQADPGQVHVTGNLSFVNTAGNSDLTTLSGDEVVQKMTEDSLWKFQQVASTVYGRSEDSTTASAFTVGGRLDRMLSSRLSSFAGANWQRNRFAGIARRFEELVGLGYQLLALERDQLSVEGAPPSTSSAAPREQTTTSSPPARRATTGTC